MLVGIDIGQSACKVTALDGDGRVLAARTSAYRTSRPQPGWVEQRPDDWVEAARTACLAIVASLPGRRVRAVAVTSATHNAVLLDERDRPVRPAILLSDARAAEDAAELEASLGGYILDRTRNRVTAGWTLPQLRWVAHHEPQVWTQVRRVVFAKDYVRRVLSGDFETDWIDAEGSLLVDVSRRAWDERLCAEVPLPTTALPRICSPVAVVGATSAAASSFGLEAGVPVVAGCSDTAAEAFAAGANSSGLGIVKLATAGNVNVVTSTPRPSPSYFTYSHALDGLSYHSFGTNAAGASREWLHHILGMATPEGYALLDAEVASLPPGAHGLLFHPYLAGERAPVFDPTLRGSVLGLSSHHTRAHLVRAVLEGVALSLADCADVAANLGLNAHEIRLIGGGASSEVWAGIVADVLGREVVRPALADASCGAALLAGAGVGQFRDLDEAASLTTRARDSFTPVEARTRAYASLLRLYREARTRIAPIAREAGSVDFGG